jgi:FeS assembly protein IscX
MDWDDCDEIARALQEKYPNAAISALDMDNSDLTKKVRSLRGFKDKNEPEKIHLSCIRNEWISLRMPETFHVNDSAYM